ncbi:hypothetical protein [Luteolibacter luteus]|uniref:HEAT repeat domain-containing protein n=1 Tax=Luteolibacter luteus TaxID=2728835 RepID=A0A858RDZ9_9BACT|nr:hypothetical protein [Luteolibacter luteus]QJE94403.1 hypothetical protein HHL09_00910 [Luteolibacter luteus]
MKGSVLGMLALVAGLLAGASGQRSFAGKKVVQDDASADAAHQTGARMEAESSRAAGPKEVRGKHDLAALLRWRQRQDSGDPELQREMERMSDVELRDLMAEFAGQLKEAGDDRIAMNRAIEMAAKELYRREGEDGIRWAFALGEGRRVVLFNMISAAAFDDPGMALPWLDGYEKEFGKGMVSTIANEAVRGATSRGAEALLKLRQLYGERLRGASFPGGRFPEDFDFKLFAKGMKGDYRSHAAMQYWAAKDKDAAWASIRESAAEGVDNPHDMGVLFSGVALMEGDRKAAEWIIPKLDEIPEDKRMQAVRGLRGQGQLTPEGARVLLPLLRNDEERVALVATCVFPMSNSGLEMLKCLPDEGSRANALLEVARSYSFQSVNVPPLQREKITGFFQSAMEELKLPEEARSQITQKYEEGN